MVNKPDPVDLVVERIAGRPFTKAAAEVKLNPNVLSKIVKRRYKVGAKIGRRLEQHWGIDHQLWWDDEAA